MDVEGNGRGPASSEGRDRDERGRPRNARPRDALGRPLPRGEGNEFETAAVPATPEEALREGVAHFNARRFFQAHEVWEEAWHPSPEPERDFWQGIIQIAVGFTHFQRGNAKGSVTLLERGARRLAPYGASYKGIAVASLAESALRAAEQIAREGPEAAPAFPSIALEG